MTQKTNRELVLEAIDIVVKNEPSHPKYKGWSIYGVWENLKQICDLKNAKPNVLEPKSHEFYLEFCTLERSGYITRGASFDNIESGWFCLTPKGYSILSRAVQNPSDPENYLNYIKSYCTVNQVVYSYIEESVFAYDDSRYKSSVIMVGGATESLIIELRDHLNKFAGLNCISDKIKTVRDEIARLLNVSLLAKDRILYEKFCSYWHVITENIRQSRNDVGHPKVIDPVDWNKAYVILTTFPELLKLVDNIKQVYV